MEPKRSKEIILNVLKNNPPIKFVYNFNYELPDNYTLHINSFYEIYIYIQGDTDYIVGDSYFSLQKGDIIFINPYEVHKPVLKSNRLYERFYFLIPVNSFDLFVSNPLQKLMLNTSNKQNLLSLPAEKRETALKILYEMITFSDKGINETDSFPLHALFFQFISLISNAPSEAPSSHMRSLPKLVWDILKYIDSNLTEIDSIEQIAAHFCISLPYLSAMFANTIGTPAKKYIQTRKIAYAKELLNHDDKSITDACYESGFNDCSYFIKIFRQHTGMTPLQYKKVINRSVHTDDTNYF